ncbi:helix-turn-helix domain-containing protein [Umezawaea tangerina]|uniref:Helix-turn-helix protein n=1 Tax=Umezawaea tangerina TaxID=84725 RepID=A0A2T0T4F1_9PSEU|nr:helix-turn-helix transcriptional regulator [Umezawaea tangerina]PRY40511.1 helix-turn-helix protein [Umezawaea tangerina]
MSALTDDVKRPIRTTSAHSRELGEELRLVRECAGLRGTAISEQLEWSPSKLSKLENGVRGTSETDIASLLTACRADKATRTRILRLAQEPDYGYFLRVHGDAVPDDLLCLRMHEAQALTISTYEPMLIPSLLQAEPYAEALLDESTASDEQHAAWVDARMERQKVLEQEAAPAATFFLHEIALRLVVGSHAVMHDQCMKLSLLSEWSPISLRVVPWSVGHPALQYGATYLMFAPHVKPMGYTDTDVATVFYDEDAAISVMQWKFDVLDQLALSPEASQDVFLHWAEIYSHGDLEPRG